MIISPGLPLETNPIFIVDNSEKNYKVHKYLDEWCNYARSIDIATGYFDVQALLKLDGKWQKLEKIRILMGEEVSQRTRRILLADMSKKTKTQLDASLEEEKEHNDFLQGVPAIEAALRSGQIECRVYTKKKFHAKAYITHPQSAVIGSFALVGSSNFTGPGIAENIELNVRVASSVDQLQNWYEEHWNESEDITAEVLKVISKHTRLFTPFEVYVKSLHEYFSYGHHSVEQWERGSSRIYKELDQYQKDGYHMLLNIASEFRGAFLCDSVGLGKTFIGLMLIDRLINKEKQKVALFVPKSVKESVWRANLKRYMPELYSGVYNNLALMSHTDLNRTSDTVNTDLEAIRDSADVIIIDEAHNFRNRGVKDPKKGRRRTSRYHRLAEICKGKSVYMLTATPINNTVYDFLHLIQLFNNESDRYFADSLGIHSLSGNFRRLENAIIKLSAAKRQNGSDLVSFTDMVEAEKVMKDDMLFRKLVVQRSRAFVKSSIINAHKSEQNKVLFPKREHPRVQNYSLKKTYGKLLEWLEASFKTESPLFKLPIYNIYEYCTEAKKETLDDFELGRHGQIVSLIRTLFLKRFESSVKAFESSCQALMLKILEFVEKYSRDETSKEKLRIWKCDNKDVINEAKRVVTPDQEEDTLQAEELEDVAELSANEFKLDSMILDSYSDMDILIKYLQELKMLKPEHDDKLQQLIDLLQNNNELRNHKVLVFTEYKYTARYLEENLRKAGVTDLEELDSESHLNREEVITRFAPYYNGKDLKTLKGSPIRVLITTDVLSEGLNLQDATFLINYDLHWNPVRLMQRIGRVDRRLNPAIEEKLVQDNPQAASVRGLIKFWNFLPPDELDELLNLFSRISEKTLTISKLFGIEGKKLLTPEDDFEALKHFNESYEGAATPLEAMNLIYQELVSQNPKLVDELNNYPGKVFSGKEHIKPGTKVVFFCFRIPRRKDNLFNQDIDENEAYSRQNSFVDWLLYDVESDCVIQEASVDDIMSLIKSDVRTPRVVYHEQKLLSAIARKAKKYILHKHKGLQLPIGLDPKILTWMELS